MEPIIVSALLWIGLSILAWHVPSGVPAIWQLRSRRDSRWPIGVQEENDERPWHRRLGTPEWRPARWPPLHADLPLETYVDLGDAGRHAPGWAIEGLDRPRLERVHRDRRRER